MEVAIHQPTAVPQNHARKCLVWGQNGNLQLGVPHKQNFEDTGTIPEPISLTQLGTIEVYCVAIGSCHSLFNTSLGLYSCGANGHGQLGRNTIDSDLSSFGVVEGLHGKNIVSIAVGEQHSLALMESGKLFSWGDNESYNQLGRKSLPTYLPGLVEITPNAKITQIAVGKFHNLALSQEGAIYVWGSNSSSQLGLDRPTPFVPIPEVLQSIRSIHFIHIAAGSEHSFALTASGSLFGWGNNSNGQLGLGDTEEKRYPCCCRALRQLKVKYITCGLAHSVALTEDGGVLTFGFGKNGQLGHSRAQDELRPKQCIELMGSTITQIACGKNHTLAYSSSSHRLYSFGLGIYGQLGFKLEKCYLPTLIKSLYDNKTSSSLQSVHAGGDSCVIIYDVGGKSGGDDYRKLSCSQQLITPELINFILGVPNEQSLNPQVEQTLTGCFKHSSIWNGSFLLSDGGHYGCGSTNHGLDLDLAREELQKLANIKHEMLKNVIESAVEQHLMLSLKRTLPDVEALRIFMLLPFLPMFNNPESYPTIQRVYGESLTALAPNAKNVLDKWMKMIPLRHFKYYVKVFKSVVKHILNLSSSSTTEMESLLRHSGLQAALNVMKFLHQINEEKMQSLMPTEFYVTEINGKVNIEQDYVNWYLKVQQTPAGKEILSFCNYPFVFDAEAKTVLLHTDARIQMKQAIESAHRLNLINLITMNDPVHPMLVITVKRDRIVPDTMRSLGAHTSNDLKKPIKVKFVDEEAVDEGGVRKEFFLLLLKEILDPKYGMFTYYSESRLLWFSPEAATEDMPMFHLIGILCGLAIYNSTIIDLPFPLALYKKLLGRIPNLDDLREMEPQIGKSLQVLLDYEGSDVEDTFCLTFSIDKEVYGQRITVDFVRNGRNIFVTNENRQNYVDEYLNYMFSTSVTTIFQEFSRGFHHVCGSKVLDFFHPMELQAMVVGNEEYDWELLEKTCKYEGEFYRNHPTIDMFWSVFHDLSEEQKKQFLLYLTGCDRIPIQGMSSLKMAIQPIRLSDNYLPVAHTCFNLLDLPVQYTSREKMRRKLTAAIQNTQGFGLV